MLTLAMAIEKSGQGKATLMRAIKARRLPANKSKTGAWQIAERDLESYLAQPGERRRPDATRAAEQAMLVTLEAENRAFRHQVDMLRLQISELSIDRDRWVKQAEDNSALARNNMLRPTSRKLAELRRDALLEAKFAAEAAAREAEALLRQPTPPLRERISSSEWTRRFGMRVIRSA